MHAAVITFPGTNREGDVARALSQAGAKVTHAWHADYDLPAGTDLVVLPASGAADAMAAFMAFVAGQTPLGVCVRGRWHRQAGRR